MPVNRNALIRYKTIDNCLRNRFRKWTLEDLIDACSDALYEYEGIDKGVSRRTVQMDIQMMRSEKLGYNTPIIVIDKKFYTYKDEDYSITNIPLTNQDLGKLTEVVDILKQFKGFTHFRELSGMVQKLEDKVHVSRTNERPVIDLEKNEGLVGLEHIDPIYNAIIKKKTLRISYQSFRARTPRTFKFHPALLKEYRNRWFVLGKEKESAPYTLLALDRIQELSELQEEVMDFHISNISDFFKDVVGVTVNEGQEAQEVKLLISHANAPYVLTKPIHSSQQLIERNDQGVIISIHVKTNFELVREILGFGDYIKVISPLRLKRLIRDKLVNALDLYDTELNYKQLKSLDKKLNARGYQVINHIYTRKEVAQMAKILRGYEESMDMNKQSTYAIRSLMKKIPDLYKVCVNENLKRVIKKLDSKLELTKAIYFNKAPQSNWYVTWHQDATINVKEKNHKDGFSGWTKKDTHYGVRPPFEILDKTISVRIHLDQTTEKNGALKVLPGSHKKILTNSEVTLITENSEAQICEVQPGGVQFMKPLLLHSSSKSWSHKNRRVIHLEFNPLELPEGMEWAERI
ncbi:phytanoyl-CoA dioxygenase family protein [Halocola ammonii]